MQGGQIRAENSIRVLRMEGAVISGIRASYQPIRDKPVILSGPSDDIRPVGGGLSDPVTRLGHAHKVR